MWRIFSIKIIKKTSEKRKGRIVRHIRSRKKTFGTLEKPRLCIFKGSRALFSQVINDIEGKTIIGIGTNSKGVRENVKGNNKEAAAKLGKIVAQKCKEKGINTVIFDKGGFKYHGVIKAFADAVREEGIKF